LIVWQAHEGHLSGANIALLEYIDALADDYRFHVVLPHAGSMELTLAKRNIPVTIVPQYNWAGKLPAGDLKRRIRLFVRSQLAVYALQQLLNKVQPAFVFTNTLVSFVAAKAAYRQHIPHVWWVHEFGEEDFGFTIGFGKNSYAWERMQRWSRLVICNSKAVTRKYKALLPAIPVECIYQPVSWHRAKETRCSNKRGYLMFGQLTASKGHLEVLEAVVKAKQLGVEVPLHIKGPCEQSEYLSLLQGFINKHNLQGHVTIETGYFQKEEVMPCYQVLIVASRSEAFGRVIVEANKAGLHVVIKNSGGAPELVNNSNGLLYHTTDELCDVFTGKVRLPTTPPLLSYSSEAEIKNLKHLLSVIR
jgi:glycosyltransferase involved in cell wall biosynthesis